jgi:hypothetical protein
MKLSGLNVVYSTFIGGNGDDSGVSIAVDSSGNAFVAGNTQAGSGFPTTTTLGPVFGQDCFVAEFDSTGGRTFSTVIGGSAAEIAEGIAVDSSGIYVAGQTSSNDLFSSPIRPFSGGTDDGFVAKLALNGTSLIYSTYIGGSALDLATGIAVDSSNNAYVSGITLSSGLGTNGSVFGGAEDGFVVKLNSTGSQTYFTYLGGSGADDANGIAVDKASGVAFVTGKTQSTDFPVAGTPFQGSLKGTQDGFVTKLNADGTIGFSTFLGGSGNADEGLAIAIDASDNVYVTGVTDSSDFPVKIPLTGSTVLSGANDAFVAELAASGSTEIFSTYFGGTGSEDENLTSSPGIAAGIAVGTTGQIFIAGSTNSASGFPLLMPLQAYGGGTADGFLANISP